MLRTCFYDYVVFGCTCFMRIFKWGWAFWTLASSFYLTNSNSECTVYFLSIGIQTQRVSRETSNMRLAMGMEVNRPLAMSCLGLVTRLKLAYFRLSRPATEMGTSEAVESSNETMLVPSSLLHSSGT